MYNIAGAVGDFWRRVVSPGFAGAWGFIRDLGGRKRRQQTAAEGGERAADKRRHFDSWNKSHDR